MQSGKHGKIAEVFGVRVNMVLIFVSFETKRDAEMVANYLVDKRLAACVIIFPVHSFYRWKGKKLTPKEFEAIIKTKRENFKKIQEEIEKSLPYEIPQIIAVEAKQVNEKYLKWLRSEVK